MRLNRREQQRVHIQGMSKTERTQLFWNVSLAQRRRGPLKGITTEQAISFLADLEEHAPSTTPLRSQVTDLLDVVIGVPRHRPEEHVAQAVARLNPDDDGPRAA